MRTIYWKIKILNYNKLIIKIITFKKLFYKMTNIKKRSIVYKNIILIS